MKEQLAKIRSEALAAFGQAQSAAELDSLRVQYLGKKGELTAVLKMMGKLSAEERPAMGQMANEVRSALEAAIEAASGKLEAQALEQRLKDEAVDVTIPGREVKLGHKHPMYLALDELNVRSLEDCVLMDARCGRPQLGDLMEQYADALELVNDGSDLGYALEEQGQGTPRFLERFAAALEFENCHDLRFALDIIQNLHCYEWIPCDSLKEFGRRKLLEAGVAEELLSSGCIDLEGYAADLLEEAGYVLTAAESAYITRNSREFIYERSAPEEAGMTMEQQ